MSLIKRVFSVAAALALVACGGGGGTGALRPDTIRTTAIVNAVLPVGEATATAGSSVAVQADAAASKAAITSHKWTIEQIAGLPATATNSPRVVDATCGGASVTVGKPISAGEPFGKDARSLCQTYVVVPPDAPASQWLVSNVASTATASDSKQFVLQVHPGNSAVGLTLSVPSEPQLFTVGQTATVTATHTLNPGVTLDTPVSYEWTQVSGAAVAVAGASTATMSFIVREPGDYAFKVTASATAGGRTDTKQATVVIASQAPGVAALGLAVSVPTVPLLVDMNSTSSVTASYSVASGVTLDGPVTFEWTQGSGTALPLAGADTQVVSFVPRTAEDFVLKVKVTASAGGRTETKEAAVVVSVPDSADERAAYQVSAGDAQIVTAPAAVLMAGTVEAGVPGPGGLVYQWTQLNGPALVTLANGNTLAASFVAEAPGFYIFELAVISARTTRRSVTTVLVLDPAP